MNKTKVLNQVITDDYALYHGDCIQTIAGMPDNSLHYSIFSPPFSSLYTYSNSVNDMGNCKDDDEFAEHFQFLIKELYRVLIPGRLLSFHCMNLPSSKQREGYIGIKDFRGDLIRLFLGDASVLIPAVNALNRRLLQASGDGDIARYERLQSSIFAIEKEMEEYSSTGFIYHSEVCIWKDPVTAMQRTKAIGLLHKQLCKDSALSRQGIPDYLVTMRKPGENPEAIAGELTHYAGDRGTEPRKSGDRTKDSINIWQRYASPVWMDINPSDTLQYQSARDNDDERHICPLQLQVIERGLQLWTNPGDVVLDPFTGIGSTGYVAYKMNRRFVGTELKESYFKAAANNLEKAVIERSGQLSLLTA